MKNAHFLVIVCLVAAHGLLSAALDVPASVSCGTPVLMKADKNTCFLLESDGFDFVDVSGNIPKNFISVKNGTIFDDPCGATVLKFGNTPGKITVQDRGKIAMRDGFSIEAWIYLEEDIPDHTSYDMAHKPNSEWERRAFRLTLKPGNLLSLIYLSFVGEKIEPATVPGREKRMQCKNEYPGQNNTMNGLNKFPKDKWTHVAFTYDRLLGTLRTWIDFGTDREAFNPWYEIASEVVDDDSQPIVLFDNARNIRIAQVRFSNIGRELGPIEPFKVYATDSTYAGQPFVTVIPASRSVRLPVDVTVANIATPVLNAVNRFTLSDLKPHRLPVPKHVWMNARSDVVVRFFKDGREFFKHEDVLMNTSAEKPASWRFLRGAEWVTGPEHPDWWLNADNTISLRGTNIFPLGMYHGTTNDFDFIADLGFDMIAIKHPIENVKKGDSWLSVREKYYSKAASLGKTLFSNDDRDGRAGEGFIYGFDEPWGYSFKSFIPSYHNLRDARTHSAELPIVAVQNNPQRFMETAQICDILGVDPYCRGRWPLRFVYDTTHMAVRDCGGQKPVLTVVDSYGKEWERPSYDELRTQVYMAVIGGASAVSFYSWDEGAKDGSDNTRNMSERVADYRKLLAELHNFAPALATRNLVDGPSFIPATPRCFFGCAKKVDGKTYLIIASDLFTTSTRSVLFKNAAGKKAALIYSPALSGASATLLFDDTGVAELTLPAQGSAVYEILSD